MPPVDEATCKRELVIEVPTEVVREETEKVAHRFQRQARVPGFRPGKTPLSLVKQRFREEIREEVLHNLVPEHFQKRVADEKMEPVKSPDISDVHLHLEGNEPLTFKAAFEVLPTFELQPYDGLAVEVNDTAVTADDLEAELKKLQESHATFEPVTDRPLAEGDFANISFEGRQAAAAGPAEGQAPQPSKGPGRPVKVDDVLCEIGGTTTLPAFSENLRGASAGEERTFTVTYPEDFDNRQLAGQTLEYTVKVEGVKQKRTPELNDDFARDLGDFQSIDDVRAKLREQMEEASRRKAESDAKDKLLNQLVNMHGFPVPDALVEKQLQTRMERTVRQLASQGVDPKKVNLDWSKVRESHRQGAVRDVKAGLLMDRIAEKEGIEVTREEMDREIEQLVRQVSARDAASVRDRLTRPEAADNMKHRLRSDKALDSVYAKARRSTSPPRGEALS